ncbi:MAG TPA: hypothetical protein DCO89_02640 [Clostridiales bacterium]|nr:hypothetical protein [Clostridiales bacterium]
MEKKVKKAKKTAKPKKKKLTKAQLKEKKLSKLPKAGRTDQEIKTLNLKLNRAVGQLNGVKKMVEEDRVCEDILIQLSAVRSAVEAVKFSILKELFVEFPQYEELVKNGSLEEILSKIKKY